MSIASNARAHNSRTFASREAEPAEPPLDDVSFSCPQSIACASLANAKAASGGSLPVSIEGDAPYSATLLYDSSAFESNLITESSPAPAGLTSKAEV